MNRKDQATASTVFELNLSIRETVRKEKRCKSANLEKAI